jgi:hypothetical protein
MPPKAGLLPSSIRLAAQWKSAARAENSSPGRWEGVGVEPGADGLMIEADCSGSVVTLGRVEGAARRILGRSRTSSMAARTISTVCHVLPAAGVVGSSAFRTEWTVCGAKKALPARARFAFSVGATRPDRPHHSPPPGEGLIMINRRWLATFGMLDQPADRHGAARRGGQPGRIVVRHAPLPRPIPRRRGRYRRVCRRDHRILARSQRRQQPGAEHGLPRLANAVGRRGCRHGRARRRDRVTSLGPSPLVTEVVGASRSPPERRRSCATNPKRVRKGRTRERRRGSFPDPLYGDPCPARRRQSLTLGVFACATQLAYAVRAAPPLPEAWYAAASVIHASASPGLAAIA